MTEPDKEAVGSAKAVYGRITWGAYDQIFTIDAATPRRFDCRDDHGIIVEISAFDSERFQTPVKLTCTATGRFLLSDQLGEAFSRLAAGELPEGSRSEEDVRRESHDGAHHSYSLPFDQYPSEVQDLMSEIYLTLHKWASHVWRLLRWRSDARESHQLFQTILASDWSRDGRPPWYSLPIKGYAKGESWGIPRLDAPLAHSVQQLLSSGIVEPTSEDLFREARAARGPNPRAALLLAVAAAEVGFKEMVIDLIPEVQWLMLNAPSPPLVGLLSKSLPELPVRKGVAKSPPNNVRKVIQRAVEARNRLAHQGSFDRLEVNLDEVLSAVRSLLRQFAYYRGFEWITPAWQ
jgi:hypothetical protein